MRAARSVSRVAGAASSGCRGTPGLLALNRTAPGQALVEGLRERGLLRSRRARLRATRPSLPVRRISRGVPTPTGWVASGGHDVPHSPMVRRRDPPIWTSGRLPVPVRTALDQPVPQPETACPPGSCILPRCLLAPCTPAACAGFGARPFARPSPTERLLLNREALAATAQRARSTPESADREARGRLVGACCVRQAPRSLLLPWLTCHSREWKWVRTIPVRMRPASVKPVIRLRR